MLRVPKRNGIVGVVALLGLGSLAWGCGGGENGAEPPAAVSASERQGGLLVMCYQRDVESLNPFVSPDVAAADLRLLLFTPLVLYGEAGAYRPHAASEWGWEEGQRRLRLGLRTDLTWHDGRPLSAEDVAWTLEVAADPEYAYASGDFASLEQVTVIDSTTLELRFAEPFLLGLEPFVWLPILPRHLLADVEPADFARADYHRAPIGSGPFRFVERRADGSLVLDRNDSFPPDLGRPHLERIVIRFISEPTTIVAELGSGNVDICVTPAGLADRARGLPRVKVQPFEPAQTQVIPLNVNVAPLDDARVRRALSAALRRSEIAITIASVARPARNPLSEASPWFMSDQLQPDADSVLATALLDSAGWRLTNGVRRDGQGRELKFTLVAPQALERSLTVVQAQLRRQGIVAELQFMEWASYVSLLRNPKGRPAAMALAFSPEKVFSPHSELYSEFHSEGFSNLGSYSVSAVDSLLESLATPITEEERRAAYREIQNRVAEDVPMIFTVSVPRLAIVGSRLQEFQPDLNGPFASAAEWWIPPAERRAGRAR